MLYFGVLNPLIQIELFNSPFGLYHEYFKHWNIQNHGSLQKAIIYTNKHRWKQPWRFSSSFLKSLKIRDQYTNRGCPPIRKKDGRQLCCWVTPANPRGSYSNDTLGIHKVVVVVKTWFTLGDWDTLCLPKFYEKSGWVLHLTWQCLRCVSVRKALGSGRPFILT